jgi:hypothetical protein
MPIMIAFNNGPVFPLPPPALPPQSSLNHPEQLLQQQQPQPENYVFQNKDAFPPTRSTTSEKIMTEEVTSATSQ